MKTILLAAILLLPTGMMCAVASASPKTERFNVRDFGAVGDGVKDDQPAINKAIQAVVKNKGGVLFFPFGTYRCARQSGAQDGIAFIGVSNVSVVFDPGAVLLMDNLNPENGRGDRGHGILFRGPCKNIWITNASVKWATKPSARSHGDGIRFEGAPNDEGCISSIHLLQCSSELSPQTGAIFMGCSDIYVENFRCIQTGGDGLHFNACRRVHVTGVTGLDNGDDVLAFVTYQDDKESMVDGGTHGPYALPDLGEWNCTNSTANNIYAKGGRANGIRLAGAKNIAISNVIVEDKYCGITSDCGKKEKDRYGWTYLASRDITITNLTANRCLSGFFVWNFNQPTSGDDRWWRFGIQLQNMIAKDCTNDSFRVASAGGVKISGVKAENCRITMSEARDCTLDNINLKNAPFIVEGQAEAAGVSEMPYMGITIRDLNIDKGNLNIYNCRGITCSDVHIMNPIEQGLNTNNIFDSQFNNIRVD